MTTKIAPKKWGRTVQQIFALLYLFRRTGFMVFNHRYMHAVIMFHRPCTNDNGETLFRAALEDTISSPTIEAAVFPQRGPTNLYTSPFEISTNLDHVHLSWSLKVGAFPYKEFGVVLTICLYYLGANQLSLSMKPRSAYEDLIFLSIFLPPIRLSTDVLPLLWRFSSPALTFEIPFQISVPTHFQPGSNLKLSCSHTSAVLSIPSSKFGWETFIVPSIRMYESVATIVCSRTKRIVLWMNAYEDLDGVWPERMEKETNCEAGMVNSKGRMGGASQREVGVTWKEWFKKPSRAESEESGTACLSYWYWLLVYRASQGLDREELLEESHCIGVLEWSFLNVNIVQRVLHN